MTTLQDLVDDLRMAPDVPAPNRLESAKALIEKTGYAAAAVTLLPLAYSEFVGVVPLHVGMVIGVARLYGVRVGRTGALKLLAKIGAAAGLSVLGSHLARSSAKWLFGPIAGFVLGAPFVYASTLALGTVARLHFERDGNLGPEQMREIYRQAMRQAQAAFDPTKLRRASASVAKVGAGDAGEEGA